jgi:hypothetical protein
VPAFSSQRINPLHLDGSGDSLTGQKSQLGEADPR